MERIVIPFTTEEAWLEHRKRDLTSSDIATLFGCGRQTIEELREHKKNGTSPEFEKNERIRWGLRFETSIAEEFAEQNKWTIHRKKEYIRIPELRLGSSFDFELIDTNKDRGCNGLIEVKNVDSLVYKNEWLTTGFEIEAPARIELQFQNELLVSGLTYGYICVCVGGNKGVCLFREENHNIHKVILNKCNQFWKDINNA